LFDRLRREDSEDHGDAGLERDLAGAASGFGGEDVEMRRLAAHESAEADDGSVATAGGDPAYGDRDLERAGNAHDEDVLLGDAVAQQAVDGARDEPRGHGVVETARHDSEPPSFRDEISLDDLGHAVSPVRDVWNRVEASIGSGFPECQGRTKATALRSSAQSAQNRRPVRGERGLEA